LAQIISRAIKTFPAVVVTGPRQSGKTTLLKKMYSGSHKLVNLEDPDIRIRAKEDPRGFLYQYRPPIMIDEIQYVPELLSYIKTRIDEDRKPGQWLLTGSQSFVLMDNITQTLAGRAAILSLLPFNIAERMDNASSAMSIASWIGNLNLEMNTPISMALEELLLRGFYPELAVNREVDRTLWCGSYITTYLERDIRNLANIGDFHQFERFLLSCVIRTGQILNLSEIARDVGISVPTAKRWLSLLESGRQIYLLYPYYRNLGKRIIKSPKIYVTDTALCSYLLGLHEPQTVLASPSFGHLFETMVVCDFWKRFLHFGEKPAMYYIRSRDGLEVDLVIDVGNKLHLFEIKSSMTITSRHASSLKKLADELGSLVATAAIISCTSENFRVVSNIANFGWQNILGM
jgi:predicted AAA+ superfamily ATPase